MTKPTIALARRIAEGPPLLLDGATGTELEHRGHFTGAPLWSTHALLTAPGAVGAIHAEYAAAGAEIITANTFRTQRIALARDPERGAALAGRDRALSAEAVALAREAADGAAHPVWVAGSISPLEDCYRPDQVPDAGILAAEHARHAENLADAGADVLLVETMNTVREAVAASRAAGATGLPILVSFVSWADAVLLSGEPLADAIDAVRPFAPLAVGVNCLPPPAVTPCLPVLAACGLPFLVYANLGEPEDEKGFERSDDCDPPEFARHAAGWITAGARIVGGCCGTTPGHIEAMHDVAGMR